MTCFNGKKLCSSISTPGSEKHGRFYFRAEGLSFGYRTLLDPLIQTGTDILVIDEIIKETRIYRSIIRLKNR